LPKFGRIGTEGLFAGLGVGAKGLVGGDGRLTGAFGDFCDAAAEGFFAVVFLLCITGCLGEGGVEGDCLRAR
tara:strand:+ start:3251 stop:3466 length:216 start_codon:yes stop_codon:yes gene_type:complete